MTEANMDVRDYVILVGGPVGPGGNYSAWCPDVLGCVAAADTYDETVTLMREALQAHLDWMREDGDEIPEPSGSFEIVQVAT